MADVKEEVITGILKYRPVKYLITIILCILVVMFLIASIAHIYRCSHSQNSKFLWGLWECEECKTFPVKTEILYKDTCVKVSKINPVNPNLKLLPTRDLSKQVIAKNSQKIDSGGSGLQNNGINNGNQAGRDINITYDKQLLGQEKVDLLRNINKMMKDSALNCIAMYLTAGSNAGKFKIQLKDALIKDGYDPGIFIDGDLSGLSTNGLTFKISKPCLILYIGTF